MGAILNVFAGAVSFTPVTQSFTTAGTFSDQAVPTGATTAVIEVFGSSGDGGAGGGSCTFTCGGGGGSGSYCKTTFNVSALNGKTFNISIAGRGSGASSTTVSAGTTNPVTGFTTMTAIGGLTGTSGPSGGGGGAGGTIATGGVDLNQTGNAGSNGIVCCSGGAGAAGKTGTNGNGGNGGNGGATAGNVGLTLGVAGRVYIRYT